MVDYPEAFSTTSRNGKPEAADNLIPSDKYAWLQQCNFPSQGPNPIIHLFLCNEEEAILRPKTGLTSDSDYQAYYLGPQNQKPLPLQLNSSPIDDDTCCFGEIDQHFMPGIYWLTAPPYLRSPGNTYIYLHFSGAHPHYLEVKGIGYDPYDGFALGLTTWVRSRCHEHLTSGLRKSMPSVLRPLLVDWLEQLKDEAL